MNKKPLVVNLFGGPGVGKSTTGSSVFAKLKRKKVLCELVNEYAKEKVWDGHLNILENQYYVFGKQLQRMLRLIGQVDVIVTDSPIVFSAFYNKRFQEFNAVCVQEFNLFNNLNFLLTREKEYVQAGRYQTEAEARQVDEQMRTFMQLYKLPHITLPGVEESEDHIIDMVMKRLPTLK